MNRLYVFFIRLMLGGLFAVIIARAFLPHAGPVYVIIFGALLVAVAYGLEYIRNRKTGG
jgi:hypothetical protein